MEQNSEITQRQTAKASFWYLVSNMMLKGLAFITMPIFARMLTKAEVGYYSNFTAWLSILTVITTLSLSTSLVRARFDYQDEIHSFVFSNLLLGFLSVVFFYIVFWINADTVTRLFALDFKYVTFMFIIMAFMPAYTMFQQLQRFAYKYKLVVALTITTSVGSVVLSLLGIRFMNDALEARILGSQLPFVAASVILFAMYVVKGKKIKLEHLKYSLAICLPFMVHLIAANLMSYVDRTMITNMCGPESTALYGMAYMIAMIVTVLWDSLNSAYSPWLGEQLHKNDLNAIKQHSYFYIVFFATCLIGVMLLAPEGLLIIGGKPYIEAQYAIPPIMLGFFFRFLYSLYVNIEQYEKKTVGMAVATVIASVLNLVLNWWAIRNWGYLAASYTTLFSFLFLLVFHYIMVRRMGYHVAYNTKFIVLVSTLIVAIGMAILVLYRYSIIRYLVIAVYLVIIGIWVLKNKEKVIGLLKK